MNSNTTSTGDGTKPVQGHRAIAAYLSERLGVHVSEDGGKSFREDRFTKTHPDCHALAIDWRLPAGEILLSEKDRRHPKLADAPELFEYDRP